MFEAPRDPANPWSAQVREMSEFRLVTASFLSFSKLLCKLGPTVNLRAVQGVQVR